MKEICETCKFRCIQECRRFPPAVTKHSSSRKEWPHVQWNDWCGEWQLDPKQKEER